MSLTSKSPSGKDLSRHPSLQEHKWQGEKCGQARPVLFYTSGGEVPRRQVQDGTGGKATIAPYPAVTRYLTR